MNDRMQAGSSTGGPHNTMSQPACKRAVHECWASPQTHYHYLVPSCPQHVVRTGQHFFLKLRQRRCVSVAHARCLIATCGYDCLSSRGRQAQPTHSGYGDSMSSCERLDQAPNLSWLCRPIVSGMRAAQQPGQAGRRAHRALPSPRRKNGCGAAACA